MRNRLLVSMLLVAGTAGAVALGGQLARAGLVTDFIGAQSDYLLEGPGDPACGVPPDTDREITVTWQDRDDAEAGFVLTRQGPLVNGTSTAQFQLPASAGVGSTVTFTDTSVVPDASYTYTVRSFLGPALSPATSTSDGCTTQSVPPAPTLVVAEGIGEHGIRISWVNNASNHEGFKIMRYVDPLDDPRPSAETTILVNPDVEFYDDFGYALPAPGLESRTEYCYTVQAYNSRGASELEQGGPLACANTWSMQPWVWNIQVGEGVRPTITWEFEDDDPPGDIGPQQTAVEVQVCAVEFGESGCPELSWRWSTGQQPFTGQSIEYLHAYPWGGALHEHPLDFDAAQRYYLRVRAWDDTGTPSEWATPLPVPYFTVEPPPGAIVNSIESSDGLTLPGGATFSESFGGEVVLVGGGSSVSGILPSLANVVSVRLLGSTAPNLTWEVKRTDDATWIVVGGDGTSPAVWGEAAPTPGLEWRVSRPGGAGQAVVGGVALLVNANHAPTVIECRAERLIGGVNEDFVFTVSVSDIDSDFRYSLTQVQFDWDGGDGSADWLTFGPGGSMTRFISQWAAQGNFTPTVQVRDQYGATSPVTSCDTVLVGSATPAWLRTQDADVFSGGTIYGRSPEGQHNATYLVQASGEIQEFSTEALNCLRSDDPHELCDPADARTSDYRQIPLPLPNGGQPLGTVLGSVDIGMEDPVDPENGTNGTGILGERYGNVTRYTGPNTNLSSFFNSPPISPWGKVLDGAIVHVLGNATVDATTTIGNAGEGQSGAGLIVVDGDLFINAPIAYDVNPVQVSLRRLASLGWLVRGNVYISPSVWAVNASNPTQACASVDAGDFGTCRPGVVGTFYLYDSSSGRGIFFTGTGGTLDDYPLMLGGLVVAQRFALQRNRPDELVPAELFRYDGRVFANPPPGLQDFAKALPRWRPLAPLP